MQNFSKHKKICSNSRVKLTFSLSLCCLVAKAASILRRRSSALRSFSFSLAARSSSDNFFLGFFSCLHDEEGVWGALRGHSSSLKVITLKDVRLDLINYQPNSGNFRKPLAECFYERENRNQNDNSFLSRTKHHKCQKYSKIIMYQVKIPNLY